MNRLIIIGNGFDLAHGFETSYSHFLLDYLKKTFHTSRSNYEDGILKCQIPNGFNTKHSKNSKELIELFKAWRGTLTYQSQFAERLVNSLIENNWVDIENEYFKMVNSYKDTRPYPEPTSIRKTNESFMELRLKLKNYLLKIDLELDHHNPCFAQIKNMLVPNESKGEFCVLNFNYTDTIENYLDESDANLIYIHGKLNDEKNPIIFGYGDDHHEDYLKLEESGNDELLKHQKSMLYPRTDNYARMEYFLESSVEQGFEVLILGHSCGLSDRTLLRTIFEHDNCKKIHIAFYKDVNDFDSKVIAISRHFNDKTKMRSRIAPFNEALRIPQFKANEA